jgi:hypothetical protein
MMVVENQYFVESESEGRDVCSILLSMNYSSDKMIKDSYAVSKKSRGRFMWTEELHQEFISSIFQIGLSHIDLDGLHQTMLMTHAASGKPEVKIESLAAHLQTLRELLPRNEGDMAKVPSNRLDSCTKYADRLLDSNSHQKHVKQTLSRSTKTSVPHMIQTNPAFNTEVVSRGDCPSYGLLRAAPTVPQAPTGKRSRPEFMSSQDCMMDYERPVLKLFKAADTMKGLPRCEAVQVPPPL